VRRHAAGRFLVLEVIAVHRRVGLRLLARHHPHRQDAGAGQGVTQLGARRRALGQPLGQDVARPGERRRRVRHLFVGSHERQRQRLGQAARGGAREQRVGQRLEAALARDLGARPALRPEGQVQVLELLLAVGGADRRRELGSQLTLLRQAREDGVAPRGKLDKIVPAPGQHLELGILEAAGHLLAVAGDERHRGALGKEAGGGFDLLWAAADLGGDRRDEIGLEDCHRGHGASTKGPVRRIL
jgi:hypothetical protein